MKFQKKNIPNLLTIFRILLFPIVVFFIFFKINELNIEYSIDNYNIFIPTNIWIAGMLFIIASLTDAIDGYLARRYNWTSLFGKIWDPVADKILVNSVLISFSVLGYIPFYLTIIMICRDIIVDAYRLVAIGNNVDVSANIYGKLKTIFQMIGLIFIFFIFANKENNTLLGIFNTNWQYYVLQNLMIFVAATLSIVSGIIYIFKFNQANKNIQKNENIK